jgi:Acetyltransferase (GNAT) domain
MILACATLMPSTTRHNTQFDTAHLAESGYRYAFFRSIEAAGADWDAAAPAHNMMLQRIYLSALEQAPPVGMRFGYLVFYDGMDPIGVANCQIQFFKGDSNINDLQTEERTACFFTGLARWFKRQVAGWAAADILICGNMLLSGDHGYYFNEQKINMTAAHRLLTEGLQAVVGQLEDDGIKVPVTLYKDITPAERAPLGDELIRQAYVEFEIQPAMVLDIARFGRFDDYLGAMSTKYRTRAKRAFKKREGIECRELTELDMQRLNAKCYELYLNIAQNAGFNMIQLNENYLLTLKRELPDQFRAFGYFVEGELVAFYTTIVNHDELEAHFLGYVPEYNHSHQLYLNILYDITRVAFESGCKQVMYSRTALEIKSSVGAEPLDLYCYLRHHNNMLNRLTGTVLEYLKPVESWQPRHPFKDHDVD